MGVCVEGEDAWGKGLGCPSALTHTTALQRILAPGKLRFEHVRVPRDALLDAFSSVAPDGAFTSRCGEGMGATAPKPDFQPPLPF
jgi:hypothetical protein